MFSGYLRREEKSKRELAWLAHATARNAMAGKNMQSYSDLLGELGVTHEKKPHKPVTVLEEDAERIWRQFKRR